MLDMNHKCHNQSSVFIAANLQKFCFINSPKDNRLPCQVKAISQQESLR